MKDNWVKARHDCTLTVMFARLSSRIQADVDQFNHLLEDDGSIARFHFKHDNDAVTIRPAIASGVHTDGMIPENDSDGLRLEMHNDRILVTRGSKPLAQIDVQWNEAALSCDFAVRGEVLSEAQASQHAIGNFLFDSDRKTEKTP